MISCLSELTGLHRSNPEYFGNLYGPSISVPGGGSLICVSFFLFKTNGIIINNSVSDIRVNSFHVAWFVAVNKG